MRAVILLNPKIPVESGKVADATFGFEYNGPIDDNVELAKYLRELADMLESKPLTDPTFF